MCHSRTSVQGDGDADGAGRAAAQAGEEHRHLADQAVLAGLGQNECEAYRGERLELVGVEVECAAMQRRDVGARERRLRNCCREQAPKSKLPGSVARIIVLVFASG